MILRHETVRIPIEESSQSIEKPIVCMEAPQTIRLESFKPEVIGVA